MIRASDGLMTLYESCLYRIFTG